MIAFLLPSLVGCVAPPLPEGSEVDEAWAVRASEVDAPLSVPCLDQVGGVGPYAVAIDDRTGWTVLTEPEGRVWLREPFGTVPDTCWWLPEAGAALNLDGQACAPEGRQVGTCGPELTVPDATFLAPGLATTGPLRSAIPVDGVLLAIGEGLERLDLTPDSDPPVDPSEGLRTWLRWLPSRETKADQIAVGTALVLWDSDRGRIELHGRGEGRRTLEERLSKRDAPSGEGVLTAAGDFAAVVTTRAVVYEGLTDGPKRDRRDHPALADGVAAAVIDPDDGTLYALVADGVVGLGPDDALSWHPTPGARGLFLGRPGGVPTPYAWGNDAEGHGILWRLGPENVAAAAHFDEQILGAGTGETFQEIVLVTREGDGMPHATGWLDQQHLDAIPDGAVGLAIAAFVESPRDPDLRSADSARQQIASTGARCTTEDPPPGLEDVYALCCAQQLRGQALERQLDWLDDRLDPAWPGGPAAVVLGVNPTAIEASRLCAAVDDPEITAMAPALPRAAGTWLLDAEARGVGSAAIFLHSAPYEADSSWVACPEAWPGEAETSCWDTAKGEATMTAFLDDVTAAASLAEWAGGEPDWRMIGGGFGETALAEVGWPDLFGGLVLPDGSPAEDGLYFGNLGMDPMTPTALSKELAPSTAAIRPFPIEVGSPADRWDEGGIPTGATYWPGQTFSMPYVWESRRSGLLLGDWIELAGVDTEWETDRYRGRETPDTMNHADFALEEHYLVTRVLAHRDVTGGRWWYFHLSDLTRLRPDGLEDGWIDCIGDCATDTELDRFLLRMVAWQPAVQWQPRPSP